MTEETKAKGVRHIMEEKMMADGVGVFEPELGAKKAKATENKAAPAPENKAAKAKARK